MAEVQWYYARNDQQFGPVSGTELKQLAEAGRLSPDDLLWREGMDAWTTAINLRGLFSEEPGTVKPAEGAPVTVGQAAAGRVPTSAARAPVSLPSLLRTMQTVLWTVCVLVVLSGLVLFTRAFLNAKDAGQEAAAAAVFSTFFIAAYVLARAGEKLARLLLARSRRRAR
jgi:hypothetical protein